VPFEIPENWAWCRLLDVCHIFGRIGFRGYTKEDLVHSGGAITLSPSNIVNGRMSYDNCTYISWDKYKESPEIQISNNDILLVKTGSSYGKCALVTDLPQAATINPQFVVLKYISYNAALLRYVLQSNYARSNYERFVLGTAIPTFTQVVLGDMLIPLPPANEQIKIIKEIDRWFAIIDEIESGTIELESYVKQTKSKILDLAISGKLVPQDPDDEPAVELLKRINPAFKPCDNSHYGNLPQGWAVCRLEDILDYEQPQAYIVNSTDYSDEYDTPVLTAGKSFIIGYTNETNGICDRLPVIIFDDFTTDSKLVDFPFKVKSSAMKILRTKGEINIDYIAYYMSITRLIGDTHKRYWISEYSKLLIPIPPYQEQLRIVDTIETIFDKIHKITAELS
jgi:type I restriction enzyme S subunit